MNRRGRGALALRYGTLLIAGLYPFAIAFGNFAGIEPLDALVLWRTVAGSCVVTLLLYGFARFVIREPDTRVLWLGILLLLCGAYALAIAFARVLGFDVLAPNRPAAFAYVLMAIAIATVVARPWQRRSRDLVPLALVACTLVAVNGYRGVARLLATPRSQWQAAVDTIVEAPQRSSRPELAAAASVRDIYYIVLDGLGRADTLQEHYGLDLGEFATFLEARGFFIAQNARSNYAHSFLSFSSFLNLDYLEPLGSAMGRDSTSWLPLGDLIQRNSLMRLAKAAGFEVTAVGSDYGPTKKFEQADVCHCQQRGLDIFEQVAVGLTPLGALPLDRWTYGAHRDKVLEAFSTLMELPASESRRLIVVHILSPHPPFTFASDGTPRRPNRAFMFSEGSDFPGSKDEYVQGYRDQTEFIISRLRATLEAILNRPGPRPAIVVHGDHGPGSMLQQNDPNQTNLPERMNIFAAYYLPDGQDRLYPSMTPVNGARALANEYLGTDLPRLPDSSWFSTARHPYDFTIVPPEAGAKGRN